ncbi:hypothetical protein VTH82DRAFT_7190 [Thermothelomyces myriococcoides]
MRYAEDDLPILSAEVYHESPTFGSPKRLAQSRRKLASSSLPRGSEEGPRKRARTQASEVSGGRSDETKRARGRPRIDTRDETAADRRRTQIRLAQRAYRDRKENAIQTLEKKVRILKHANEEMNNAFMQLHDLALRSGLADKLPELDHQLRQTAERYLSLAREVSEDDASDGQRDRSMSQTRGEPNSYHTQSGSQGQPDTVASSVPATSSPRATTGGEGGEGEGDLVALSGGPSISSEPVTQAEFTAQLTLDRQRHQQDHQQHESHHQQSLQALPAPDEPPNFTYEILTQPTLENASFPFQSTPFAFSSQDFSVSPLIGSLPMPETYAGFEATFGRRLQRYSVEQAYAILSMPDPPPRWIKRVFGFSLTLESIEAIRRRLRRMLDRDHKQSLYNWQYPFYHLGGAGTHFDTSSSSFSAPTFFSSSFPTTTASGKPYRIGNQGTVDVLKPQVTAGFAMGPFSREVHSAQDQGLDENMHITLEGFDGEYFDCDETELYLLQHGVVIPPGADIITIDVDLSQMETYEERGWRVETVDPLFADASSSSSSSSPWPMGDGGGMAEPGALTSMFPAGDSFLPATTAAEPSGTHGGGMLPFGFLPPSESGDSGYFPNTQRVVLDVMTLVKSE